LVENFEADFPGTNLYKPLYKIFTQISCKKIPVKKTHIFLLTNGEDESIIEFVKNNCGPLSNI
jgi:hypothetical protein